MNVGYHVIHDGIVIVNLHTEEAGEGSIRKRTRKCPDHDK